MTKKKSHPRLTELAKTIGFEIVEFTKGKCVVECIITENHLNMGGVVHGGIHATMLDTAMGGTLVSTLKEEEWCATAQLDISYINPAKLGEKLNASASVVRRGRNLAHLEGNLVSEKNQLIATAKGTWAIWVSKSTEND